MKPLPIIICFSLLSLSISAQQVLPLYPGLAPGSESWTHQEKRDTIREANNHIFVNNVVHLSLTVYKPEKPNGMAMIVCPGGAFRALSIQSEGTNVARWLNTKGITAFVLKYRLVPEHIASREQAMEDIRTQNSKRIVDWFCPVDFLIMDSCGSSFSHFGPYSPEAFLMGGPIQKIKAKVALTNPVHDIHPGTPPFLLFHGDQDFQVPACQSQKLHEHLKMKKIQSEMVLIPGGGHGPGVMIDYYYDRMIRFLDGELKKVK